MIQINPRYSILVLLLILGINAFGQEKYVLYINMSLNSCNNCNHIVSSIESKSLLFENTTIILNPEETNNLQAADFLQNIFTTIPKYIIDSDIYGKISKLDKNSIKKLPIFVLSADSCKSTICFSTIDSLEYYLPFINKIMDLDRSKTNKFKHNESNVMKRIYGWKNIEPLMNRYIISSYQLEQKFYILNGETQNIDSFFLNDNLLKNLILLGTGLTVDISQLKKYYKQLGLPSLYSINPTPMIRDSSYLNSFSIVYLRNEPNDSILESDIFNYLFDYDLITKKISIVKQEYIDTILNLNVLSKSGSKKVKSTQDNFYLKKLSDRNWEILLDGNFETVEKYSKLKIKCELRFDSITKQLRFHKFGNIIYLDSAFTFDGEPMNKPNVLYQYMITESFFTYKQCPILLMLDKNQKIDLRKYDKNMRWIHSMSEDFGVLKILYQNKSAEHKLLVINKLNLSNFVTKNLTSLNKVIESKPEKYINSNINFGLNNSVVFIDKYGNLVESTID